MHCEIARALDPALTLASDGQRCFPCFKDKRPATSYGSNAESDHDKARDLWARYLAPLVGVVTGEISNIELDIDAQHHADAATWLAASRHDRGRHAMSAPDTVTVLRAYGRRLAKTIRADG